MSFPTHITVRGAAAHNLQGVDLDIPRDQLVVFTGVSGSGKSSLAFDTIFQEGQRRFMDSLSAYARQFLGQIERPKVESVDGLSPTVSIDQKTTNRNPRSTVGTVTEIYDHLRLLMARLGTPRCPECHTPVSRVAVGQIVDQLLGEHAERTATVLAPIVRERKGEYRKELEDLRRRGWLRVRLDGEVRRLDDGEIALARYEKHTIEIVVDRVRLVEGERRRLAEAIESAVREAGGVLHVQFAATDDAPEALVAWSTERACPTHPEIAIPELEPRLFSFNAPQGACPTCDGLGALERWDLGRLFDASKSVEEGFLGFNEEGRVPFTHLDRAAVAAVARRLGVGKSVALKDWPADAYEALLRGRADLTVETEFVLDSGRKERRERPWVGLLGTLDQVWMYTSWKGLEGFRARQTCPDCAGERLHRVARAVDFRGRRLPELTRLSVAEAHTFFQDLRLTAAEAPIGALLVQELQDRLTFLHEVGLDYLTLDRSSATLSGGEAQRIRLAAQVGSGLQGVTYVLDEPSIGLHPRDNARLLSALHRLRDRGNSVLVVEHDHDTIHAADFVVEVGPGAGRQGGRVTAAEPQRSFRGAKTLTAAWLRGERHIPIPERRPWDRERALTVRGARKNNLSGVDATFPLGTFTVVTGVSGSGKSSLVFGVLEPGLQRALAGERPTDCAALEGAQHVDKMVRISQQPIGRTPRSNPATYVGLFDPIRDLFAAVPESRARGYKKGRFSFNVKGGRCEACEGAGVKTVEMQFLPSVEVPCEICDGSRFNAETLEIRYRDLTIAEVLALTVDDALPVFSGVPTLRRILETLRSVGLGYLPLGQPSTTLSGGEAQRLKLATELHRPATGRTVYLLDEPTTGLHVADVAVLLDALQRLVAAGNTVIVVEHHTDVIKVADHVIDLGPDGGDGGGQVVAAGTPEQVARAQTPTGRALAALPELRAVGLAAEPALPRLRALPAATRRAVEIRGARQHNLRSIDVSIPHGSLTVITGPSGSGKTSLAFDTLFSEGQRRYVESLSTYARRFLGRMERAPLDTISGLAPAIAIDQKTSSHNPRSTVGTVTEIHDVLRLLWARVGTPHCPRCDREVAGRSPSLAARDLRVAAGGAGWITAALPPPADPVARVAELQREGFTRLLRFSDGSPAEVPLDEPHAATALADGAELVIDRLNPARDAATRVSEAIAAAYQRGGLRARFVPRDGRPATVLSERPSCPEHGPTGITELTPRHFSHNARLGACTACDGLGLVRAVSPERLFPSPAAGFWEALDPRVASALQRGGRTPALIRAVLRKVGLDANIPWARYTPVQRAAVLEGMDGALDVRWSAAWGRTTRDIEERLEWHGLVPLLAGATGRLDWLLDEVACPVCRGGRLRPELLAVRVGGQGIGAFSALTIDAAAAAVEGWSLEGERAVIAARPLQELTKRLRFLRDVGLGYLSLDRPAETLSGGESQRIRLASQLGSGLVGTLYVLDEPTIGLHPRDTERLLGTLAGLRDLGNTVVVVEHDPDTILAADRVIDLGPGAGAEGGAVMASGTPAELLADPRSPTGRWLAGVERCPTRPPRPSRGTLALRGCDAHNLRVPEVALPLGVWTAVSGPSGSGKSTLILDTLVPLLRAHIGEPAPPARGTLSLDQVVDRLVVVDQQPIGTTPRSTPATYTKIMDGLREIFAATPEAQARGWGPGRFSFNGAEGRCTICEGRGAQLIEMHFLPDVWIECPECQGRRYDRETLEVRFKGLTIADVLRSRVDALVEVFQHQRKVAAGLRALVDVGLGYLPLGQPGHTLSGGEAQRVKLAAELTSRKGHAVYVLDEPTTGLHLSDTARLITVLHRLVDAGHTVITVEHHLDMLNAADWVVDLGPDGGAGGGQVVAVGTPETLAINPTATGIALRHHRDRLARLTPEAR